MRHLASTSNFAALQSSIGALSGIGMENSADWKCKDMGERIANLLRTIHPYSTAKLVARDLGVSVRTAENWLAGNSAPALEHFARMLVAYGPRVLVAVAPCSEWLAVAVAAVEQEALEAELAKMPAKRQRALDALRGRS